MKYLNHAIARIPDDTRGKKIERRNYGFMKHEQRTGVLDKPDLQKRCGEKHSLRR
jgi:hypothetical protein